MKLPHEHVRARWVRVSDACCQKHGEQGALDEALRELIDEYEELREYWRGKGARIHFVMYVEKPDDEDGDAA